VITAAVIYLRGMMTAAKSSPTSSTSVRFLSFVGFFVTAALLFLGVISPYYAIVAIPVIPAPLVFGVLIFRPTLVSQSPKLRIYLKLCVAAAALTWAFQLVWDLRG
jgi:hypothetical protein